MVTTGWLCFVLAAAFMGAGLTAIQVRLGQVIRLNAAIFLLGLSLLLVILGFVLLVH